MKPEDADLIAQARGGDANAFAQLYERYRSSLYRTAFSLTQDPNTAEEVVQDCLMRAYANLDRLHAAPPIGPWLQRVTTNLSLTYLRRVRGQSGWRAVSLHVVPDTQMPTRSPEAASVQGEMQEAVRYGLSTLSPNHQLVIVLYYLQGLSLGEIAQRLACPVGTVKSRLYHARRYLCEVLQAYDPAASYSLL